MKLNYLTLPEALRSPERLPIPLAYFNTEVAKILTGYGYSKPSWIAEKEFPKRSVRIENAFEEYVEEWGGQKRCRIDHKVHFGHIHDERQCYYDALTALEEIFQAPNTPHSVMIAIQRRIYHCVDMSLPEKKGDLGLDIAQVETLFYGNTYPFFFHLLEQVYQHGCSIGGLEFPHFSIISRIWKREKAKRTQS